MNRLSILLVLGLVACGASKPEPTAATTTSSSATTAATASSASARPSCDAIDEACDPHESKGGLAKECHDLGEASATSEATCAARKAECLAACPR